MYNLGGNYSLLVKRLNGLDKFVHYTLLTIIFSVTRQSTKGFARVKSVLPWSLFCILFSPDTKFPPLASVPSVKRPTQPEVSSVCFKY